MYWYRFRLAAATAPVTTCNGQPHSLMRAMQQQPGDPSFLFRMALPGLHEVWQHCTILHVRGAAWSRSLVELQQVV